MVRGVTAIGGNVEGEELVGDGIVPTSQHVICGPIKFDGTKMCTGGSDDVNAGNNTHFPSCDSCSSARRSAV